MMNKKDERKTAPGTIPVPETSERIVIRKGPVTQSGTFVVPTEEALAAMVPDSDVVNHDIDEAFLERRVTGIGTVPIPPEFQVVGSKE